jgi:hypothetical protein
MPAKAVLVALVFSVSSPAFADCKQPETGTKNTSDIFTTSMTGVFVIPRDQLITYAQSNDGWSSVMYSNPKTGNNVSGWVKSSRLKETGTVGH